MKLLRRLGVCLTSVAFLAACTSTPAPRARVAPPTPAPAFTEDPAPEASPGPTVAAEVADPVVAEEAVVTPPAPILVAGPPAEEPLGMVAGIPLRAEDVLTEWYQVTPREVWLVVDKLVAMRLASAEAGRLGVSVAAAEVKERYDEEVRLLAADVARERPGMSVEQFVAEVLGQDPTHYGASLQRAAADQMLIERVVRAWVLANENLALRLIVVPAGDMETIQGLLAKGEDFAEVARVHSVDDTAEFGGLVPYIVRQEQSPLTRVAFETPVGEVGGPLRAGEHELLFRVEARRDARPEEWDSLRGAVLESLAAHPVSDSEFMHWKLAMERTYPVDLRRLKAVLGVTAATKEGAGG